MMTPLIAISYYHREWGDTEQYMFYSTETIDAMALQLLLFPILEDSNCEHHVLFSFMICWRFGENARYRNANNFGDTGYLYKHHTVLLIC